MPADAGIRFGQYVLVRRIARGGMAEVFLAQQRGLEGFDRRVAVKRILPHLADSPDFVKMFFGEARLAAQLSHPNIVHIYEFGKVEHDYFIAMEFVDGVHTGQLFKHGTEQEKLPATLVARIGADAANALHYAHELRDATGKPLGLVHRDVSPANIMVSFDGVVKLCDFGIAKAAAASDHLTNPGQVKGKYAYMSPEQTIASQLDGRSDVFSLAIVMWELLTGKTIVPRGDAVAAMRAIRDGKLEPIEKVNPSVPAPLAAAVTWALETKRDKRASAAELAQALEGFLKSAPDLATSMQLGGWIRARFPREGTGQLPALTPGAPAAGAFVAPGTVVAPGTAMSPSTAVSPHTVVAPGTAVAALTATPPPLFAVRRVVKLVADTTDGTEIYTTSDLDEQAETIKGGLPPSRDIDDESAETIKGAKPPRSRTPSRPNAPIERAGLATARPAPPTESALTPAPRALPDEPTLYAAPPVRPDATELLVNAPVPADEEDTDVGGDTIQRDPRAPHAGAAIAVPTRVQSQIDARANADPRAVLEAASAISDGASRAISSSARAPSVAAGRGASDAAARGAPGSREVAVARSGALDVGGRRAMRPPDASAPVGVPDVARAGPGVADVGARAGSGVAEVGVRANSNVADAGMRGLPGAPAIVARGPFDDVAARAAPAAADGAVRAVPAAPDAHARAGKRAPLVEGRRPVDATELARKRRNKLLLAIVGLAGLALVSFAIALAASSSNKSLTPTHDAAATAVEPPPQALVDAALQVAPPPVDAAPAPTVPGEPTVPAEATLPDPTVPTMPTVDAGVDEGMAYLVVRTIPDGGHVKVGDQSRLAVVQPGDPTGAATAQLVLPAGKHVVTAELEGYRPEKRAVVLARGDHQRIEITFTKKIATRPDRGPAMGRLTVRTTPWSDVYLGSKKLGQAPFADLELPAGTHTLTFKNPSRPTVTKTVTIKAGKSAKLNFNLP